MARADLTHVLLELLPKRVVSRLVGELCDVELPPCLRRPLFGAFARKYGVALEELDRSIEEFPSFAEFFGRPLRPGARPVEGEEDVLVSPVDGTLVAAERLHGDTMLEVKGNPHSVSALLRGLPDPEAFRSGQQLTLYLAPGDYHRIHAPSSGRITRWSHEPGALFPVNEMSFTRISGLFGRNERVALELESPAHGRVVLVLVGALNVGSIRVPCLPALRTNVSPSSPSRGQLRPPATIARGAELAAFGFGSTVVVLLENAVEILPGLAGRHVRCGASLGRTHASGASGAFPEPHP